MDGSSPLKSLKNHEEGEILLVDSRVISGTFLMSHSADFRFALPVPITEKLIPGPPTPKSLFFLFWIFSNGIQTP
jgi:hypothetical protein